MMKAYLTGRTVNIEGRGAEWERVGFCPACASDVRAGVGSAKRLTQPTNVLVTDVPTVLIALCDNGHEVVYVPTPEPITVQIGTNKLRAAINEMTKAAEAAILRQKPRTD